MNSELPPSPSSKHQPSAQETDSWNKARYEEFAQTYLESNADGRLGGSSPAERAAYLQTFLPAGRTVLEIGSGGGDGAQALTEAGYTVIPSEFTPAFIEILRKKGSEPLELNAKVDDLPGNIDAIFANAVFVHFSPEDLFGFLKRAAEALNQEKIIFFSVIASPSEKVEYQRTSARAGFERDFYYYPYKEVVRILDEAGFTVLGSREIEEASPWIQIVAKK